MTVEIFLYTVVPKLRVVIRRMKSSNAYRAMPVSKTNQDPTFKFLVDLKASEKKEKLAENVSMCSSFASLSP